MKRLLALLLFAPSAWAQTNCTGLTTCNLTATDMASPTAFATALNTVNQDPATVNIPAGSFTWSSGNVTVTFTRAITIQGAGAQSATTGGAGATGSDLTTILDHVPGSGTPITFTTAAGKAFRITGIFFKTDGGSVAHSDGIVVFQGGSTSARIDHLHVLTQGGFVGIEMAGVIGVADHNFMDCGGTGSFNCLNNHYAFHNYGADGWGDDSYTQPDNWGSSSFMFIEDNYFHNGGLLDAAFGGRYVVRHSTCIADPYNSQFISPFPNPPVGVCQLYSHGLTPGNQRSMRAAEIYLNNIQQPTTYIGGAPNTTDLNQAGFSMNGGTELNWGNTVNLLRELLSVDYTRKADNPPNYTYAAPPTGWGHCDGGATFDGWDNPSGYPCLDGVGRGAGDQLSGNLPSRCNLTTNPACNVFTGQQAHQVLSPVYVWNNTFNNHATFGTPNLVAIQASQIVNNRDIYQQFGQNGNPGTFNGTTGIGQGAVTPTTAGAYTGAPNCTAGPGGNTPGVGWWDTANSTLYVCNPTNTWTAYYTPYTYPHPLTAGGSPTPLLVISPSPAVFPNQNVGTTSAPLTITVTNNGTAPEVLATPYFTITGTDASNFANTGTGTCTNGATIAVSGSCTIKVTFTPAPTGLRSAPLNILGTVSGTVSLQGTGTSPVLSLTPNPLAFGNQTISTTSAPLAITTTNTGTGPEVLATPHYTNSNPTEFLRTGGSCADAASIPAGSNCTDIFSFKPSAIGARSGTFTIRGTINGTDSMTGTGTAVAIPVVQLGPRTVNFGTVNTGNSSLPLTFTLQNTGTATLNITSISSSDTIQFPISAQLCGATLAPSATCTFADSCAPLTATSLNAIITVSTNASSSPDLITLACTGATPPVNPPPAPAPVIFIGSTLPAQPIVSNVGLTAPCPMNNRCTYVMSCTQCSALTQLYIDNVLTAQNYFNGTMTYTIKLVAGTHSYLAVNLQ